MAVATGASRNEDRRASPQKSAQWIGRLRTIEIDVGHCGPPSTATQLPMMPDQLPRQPNLARTAVASALLSPLLPPRCRSAPASIVRSAAPPGSDLRQPEAWNGAAKVPAHGRQWPVPEGPITAPSSHQTGRFSIAPQLIATEANCVTSRRSFMAASTVL